ncbi:S1C family serine protease [Paenibacillus marinisediminis]
MEDQRKSYSTSDQDNNTQMNGVESTNPSNTTETDQSETTKSHYFAYGPYQSGKGGEAQATTSVDGNGQASDVQVTQPAPVKPMPFSSTTRQSYANYGPGGATGNGAGGNGGSAPSDGGKWNFKPSNEKKGASFKSIVASFLAGAIVISGLMFTADYTNLFTGGSTQDSARGANGTAQTVSNNSSGAHSMNSVSDVVKSASPAVVKIETFATPSNNSSNMWWMEDPLFRQFFGDSYGDRGNQESQPKDSKKLQPLGIGTGFIFESDGYILTNNHVIEGGEAVQVTIEGYEKPLTAKVLGRSPELDLAVLKVDGKGFPTVSLGDSDAAEVGEQVVAIGNPSGFDHSVTSGWLSAKGRSIDVNDNGKVKTYNDLLQTDAAINPGNSGGPLLNMNGEVIGMNVAVSKEAQGIGFAIPSNTITKVVDNLKENKEIPKEPVPFIGATLYTMTEDVANQIGIPNTEGALIYQVLFGSPAYEADLRAYDVITKVDGKKITTKEELIEAVQSKKVGDTITLTVERNKKSIDVDVKIGDKNKFQPTEQ